MVRKNPYIYYTPAYEDVKLQDSIDIFIILLQFISTTSHLRIEQVDSYLQNKIKLNLLF